MDLTLFAQTTLNAVMLGVIYALIAFGFTLIFGISRIMNFAHGEVYMLGSIVIFFLIKIANLPIIVAIIVCAVVVAIIGAAIEWLVFRPIRPKSVTNVEEQFPAIVISISLVSVIPAVVILLAGTTAKGIPSYISGILNVGGVKLSTEELMIMIIALALFVGLLFFVWKHREGRAMSAVSQDMEAAVLQGVSLQKINTLAFVFGFGLAAIAAALVAPLYFVDPTLGPSVLLKTFIVVILGGVGSVPGTLLGGLIVAFIEQFGQALLPGALSTLLAFLLVIIILVLRPRGLLGHD